MRQHTVHEGGLLGSLPWRPLPDVYGWGAIAAIFDLDGTLYTGHIVRGITVIAGPTG